MGSNVQMIPTYALARLCKTVMWCMGPAYTQELMSTYASAPLAMRQPMEGEYALRLTSAHQLHAQQLFGVMINL